MSEAYQRATELPEILAENDRNLPASFILKVNSRCQLACDYCYMYESVDQSWENQPIHMSRDVVDASARAVGGYAKKFGVTEVGIILHGGEPLLEEPEFFDYTASSFMRTVNEITNGATVPRFYTQTNLVRLDEPYLKVFKRWGIQVGASIDGSREANDLHRVYRNGRSSYDDVMRGWERLNAGRYQSLANGILAVADLRSDPLNDVYRPLRALGPKAFDIMWPHGNWETPPPAMETHEDRIAAPYAAWTMPMAHEYLRNAGDQVPVRRFEAILDALAGRPGRVESIGGGVLNELVIETDGSIQGLDIEKTSFSGGPELGKHVFTHSIEEAVVAGIEKIRRLGVLSLSEVCQPCVIKDACNAGYYVNRWKDGSYENPSVYHYDLLKLFTYMQFNAGAIVAERKRMMELEDLIERNGYRAG
jgi:uncharacterized protein